jgi:ABC-2 type transport system ATP-binding protein
MILVEGLTKNFGVRHAIENITFRAEKGEILGILGSTQSGKTTILRILAGYFHPTGGKAKVAGFDVVKESKEARSRTGYMPEGAPLYLDLTVRDFLYYVAELRHLGNATERVEGALEKVGLTEAENTKIKMLAKGLRKKLSLGQAILHNPDVLLLDEPFRDVDRHQRDELRHLIHDLSHRCTVLFSTRVMSDVQQLCKRVLLIDGGHLVVDQPPARLQSQLAGAKRVYIRVSGDDDGFRCVVERVPGVSNVTPRGFGGLEFDFLTGQDARPLVVRELVNEGFDIIEMRQTGSNLDEIFQKLTRDEPAPPEMDDGILDELYGTS